MTACSVQQQFIESARHGQATRYRGSLPRLPRCAGSAQLVADRPLLRS